MIKIFAWDANVKKAEMLEADDLRGPCDHLKGPQAMVWIDLAAPTEEEENLVFQQFYSIHSLSLADINQLRRLPDAPPHFPKAEEFPDYLFVIVNPLKDEYLNQVREGKVATGEEMVPFTQLSAVITANLLITHHAEPLACISLLQNYLARHESQAERGPDYLFHVILDATVDQYAPVLDLMDESLDGMELEVVERPSQAAFLRLLRLKHEIIHLRKTMIYEREVLVRLARGEFEQVDDREAVYYRNVYDHLVRFTELIESSREMVTDLMQSYQAATAIKTNEIMKVLTMISTIVLPMTLVAGVYGMNFEELPGKEYPHGFTWSLVGMAIMGIISVVLFRWKRWL